MSAINDLITDGNEDDNEEHDYVWSNEDVADDRDSWNWEEGTNDVEELLGRKHNHGKALNTQDWSDVEPEVQSNDIGQNFYWW